jgi:hypothetical protein
MLTSGLTTKDAILSGMAGAAALTAVHQAARMVTDSAPQMDVVGMRAITRGREAAAGSDTDAGTPEHPSLYNLALAGDLFFNSAYYSMATTWTRGAALGILAGVGALFLPQKLGLGTPPKSELLSNQVMRAGRGVDGALPRREAGRPDARVRRRVLARRVRRLSGARATPSTTRRWQAGRSRLRQRRRTSALAPGSALRRPTIRGRS